MQSSHLVLPWHPGSSAPLSSGPEAVSCLHFHSPHILAVRSRESRRVDPRWHRRFSCVFTKKQSPTIPFSYLAGACRKGSTVPSGSSCLSSHTTAKDGSGSPMCAELPSALERESEGESTTPPQLPRKGWRSWSNILTPGIQNKPCHVCVC